MDNFKIDVTSRGVTHLRAALSIFLIDSSPNHTDPKQRKIEGYQLIPAGSKLNHLDNKVTECDTMVIFSFLTDRCIHEAGKDRPIVRFPAPLEIEAVLPVIMAWLDVAKRGPAPTFDGDAKEDGWRLTNRVSGIGNFAIVLQPQWSHFGK